MGKMEQEKLTTPIIVCLQSKQEPIINYLFILFNFEKHFNKLHLDSKQKLNHCNLAKINNTNKQWL